MDTYILNGVEVSAEQLASYARAAGISLEQFKEDNGVTVKSCLLYTSDAADE